MDNNAVEEIPGIWATEETKILDPIENWTATSTIYTTLDMDITGVDIYNTGVRFENTGLSIKTPGVQDTSHKDKNSED